VAGRLICSGSRAPPPPPRAVLNIFVDRDIPAYCNLPYWAVPSTAPIKFFFSTTAVGSRRKRRSVWSGPNVCRPKCGERKKDAVKCQHRFNILAPAQSIPPSSDHITHSW